VIAAFEARDHRFRHAKSRCDLFLRFGAVRTKLVELLTESGRHVRHGTCRSTARRRAGPVVMRRHQVQHSKTAMLS